MSARRFLVGAGLPLLLSLGMIGVAHAFDIPPNDGLVTVALSPGTVVLTPQDVTELKSELQAYDRETSNQIAIVLVQSLGGTPIEDAALAIGRKWGVGSAKNNGILLLFSYDDRQVRIEVGYGLEGAVPDLVTKGIIETDMLPRFREGDYAGGFLAAVDSLKKHIGGEYTADRYAAQSDGASPVAFLFFFGFILFQWLLSILGRTKSWWLGGVFGAVAGIVLVVLYMWWLAIPILTLLGLLLDYIVSKNYNMRGRTMWWAGGSWGPGGSGRSSGSGGFGGFGGGGFGGGGASGRW